MNHFPILLTFFIFSITPILAEENLNLIKRTRQIIAAPKLITIEVKGNNRQLKQCQRNTRLYKQLLDDYLEYECSHSRPLAPKLCEINREQMERVFEYQVHQSARSNMLKQPLQLDFEKPIAAENLRKVLSQRYGVKLDHISYHYPTFDKSQSLEWELNQKSLMGVIYQALKKQPEVLVVTEGLETDHILTACAILDGELSIKSVSQQSFKETVYWSQDTISLLYEKLLNVQNWWQQAQDHSLSKILQLGVTIKELQKTSKNILKKQSLRMTTEDLFKVKFQEDLWPTLEPKQLSLGQVENLFMRQQSDNVRFSFEWQFKPQRESYER